MKMESVTAVIPIRKGSRRVKDKNLRAFANTTLLDLKIKTLKSVKAIERIIVNTDSEPAIEIAIKHGVEYHRRQAYYASSECSGSDFFKHLGEVTDTRLFAYCPVTSPFVSSETISHCIKKFFEDIQADSLTTVSDVKEFLWKDGKPLNYDLNNAPNSQGLPDINALNFGFSIIEVEKLIECRNIIGKTPTFVKIDEIESIDIDTELDFFIAEELYKKKYLDKKTLLDE